MTVEEGLRVVHLEVQRSQGALDEVSVDMVTRAITAHSQMGADMYLSPLQQVSAQSHSRQCPPLTRPLPAVEELMLWVADREPYST